MSRLGLLCVSAFLSGCLYPDLDKLTDCSGGCGGEGTGGEAGSPVGGAGAGGGGGQGGTGGAFVPVTYEEHILFEEPLAYYRLGDAEVSGPCTDEMGRRDGRYQSGVVVGVAGAIAGDEDTAIEIQDVDDGYDSGAFLGDNFGFPGDAKFTFEYWVKPTTTDLFGFSIFGKCTAAPEHPGLYATTRWDDGIYFPFFCRRALADQHCVQGMDALPTDSWTFLAVTYANGTLRLYVNGEAAGSSTENPPLEVEDVPGEEFRIGNINGFGILEAYVDEFAVWDRDLSETVIRRHYRVGMGLDPEEE